MSKTFLVKVGGDYACFTNPNLKVERVSYPAITPGAARGLLEAIFWKPAFRWEIRSITILKPIKTLNVMRNEIEIRQDKKPILVEEKRQQRISLILKDVQYVIEAEMALIWKHERIEKYNCQFQRKLERGACHHTPYLGTREFAAWFEPATGSETPEIAINSQYLGVILFDTAYVKSEDRTDMRFLRHDHTTAENKQQIQPEIQKGYQHYLFFPASIENNKIIVPRERYHELYELEGLNV